MISNGFDLPYLRRPKGPSSEHDEEAVWKDRRAHERRELVARASVTTSGGVPSPGITENLSQGGLFVGTMAIAAVGDLVTLSFRLPGRREEIHARAEVMRVRALRPDRPEMMPGLGLRFVDLADDDFDAIGNYVEQRLPRFSPS